MKRFFFIVYILAFLLSACTTEKPEHPSLILITTTSTQDSGLLDVLVPIFEKQTGTTVQLVAAGSGQALKLGEQGNADVLLVHSPAAENKFMENGFGIDRRLVMHNDFVIIGPSSDPAGIRGKNPVEALQQIQDSGATFVSRGDESGTHVKELALWGQAGLDPAGNDWYLETGQGQGATLQVAYQKGAYTLTDRGTYLAYRDKLDLGILVEGDPFLANVYHVITINPEKWPNTNVEAAQAFADFITSPEGQKLIGAFGVDKYGQPLFFTDAGKNNAETGAP